MNSFVVMIELRIFRMKGLFLKVIKLSTVFAIIFLTLGIQPSFAKTEQAIDPNARVLDVIDLSDEEISRLKSLGFSNEVIQDMTWEEYQLQEGLTGELITTDEKWFRYNSKTLELEEISEKQALNEYNKFKSNQPININNYWWDPEELSWMRHITSVSKLNNGRFRLQHQFTWKNQPLVTLQDAVAITYSPHLTYVQNSEYFRYTYDRWGINYVDSKNVVKHSADRKSPSAGIGFIYDIVCCDSNYEARNHRGYMYFDVVVSNSNYSSANAFGHYGHTTLALGSIGLDLSTGSFKITPSLTTIVTYMRDTGVTFQTK